MMNLEDMQDQQMFENAIRTLTIAGEFEKLQLIINSNLGQLKENIQYLDNILGRLDYNVYSLAVLVLLDIKFEHHNQIELTENNTNDPINTNNSKQDMCNSIKNFIIECDEEQIKLIPGTYAKLCHRFTRGLVDLETTFCGIELLRRAIYKVQAFKSQLTSIHSDLCQLCLLSNCLKPALELLDTDIIDIIAENGQFDSVYFLHYYYYGGMIYIALQNYDQALFFFEICLIVPTKVIIPIIFMAAYKKYILISLILHNKVLYLSQYISPEVMTSMQNSTDLDPYKELVSAYQLNNYGQIQMVIDKYRQLFENDFNLELVAHAIKSLIRMNVRRLKDIYLNLNLTDIANTAALPKTTNTERFILNMIEDDEICASINKKDDIVTFYDNNNSTKVFTYLEEQIVICKELSKQSKVIEEKWLNEKNLPCIEKLILLKD